MEILDGEFYTPQWLTELSMENRTKASKGEKVELEEIDKLVTIILEEEEEIESQIL